MESGLKESHTTAGKIVVQTLQYNWDTKTVLARSEKRKRRKEDGVNTQEINWVELNNSELEILHHSLARPRKNSIVPIHLALLVFFLAGQKKDGGGMVYFMFCRMHCVHLVRCVTKHSLGQVRQVKETLLRETPNPNQLQTLLSCYGLGGSPPVFLAQLFCLGWLSPSGCWFKGRPCLLLVFTMGETWTLESATRCNSQSLWLPLDDTQIYKAFPENQGLPESNQTGLISLLPVAFMTHLCLRWQSSSLSTKR